MSSKLFKNFIKKAILDKQPTSGPPRPGLQWKPTTHRWIRPKEMIPDVSAGWGDISSTGKYNSQTSPLGSREKEIKDLYHDRALDALINGEIDVERGNIEGDLIDEIFLNGDILGQLGIEMPGDNYEDFPDVSDDFIDDSNEHLSKIIDDATTEFMNREGTRELLTGSGVEGYDEW